MPRATVFRGQRGVVVLELPHLPGQHHVAFFHAQLLLGVVDGQTLFTATVPQLFRLRYKEKKKSNIIYRVRMGATRAEIFGGGGGLP